MDSRRDVSYVKGALEVVVTMCRSYVGNNGEALQLTASATDRVHQQSAEMARDGLRVIAIACGAEPGQLTLCGIVGLKDPLRDGVVDAVHRIQDSGARVMMITGDSQETATSIARSAGIYDPHRCLHAHSFNGMYSFPVALTRPMRIPLAAVTSGR